MQTLVPSEEVGAMEVGGWSMYVQFSLLSPPQDMVTARTNRMLHTVHPNNSKYHTGTVCSSIVVKELTDAANAVSLGARAGVRAAFKDILMMLGLIAFASCILAICGTVPFSLHSSAV